MCVRDRGQKADQRRLNFGVEASVQSRAHHILVFGGQLAKSARRFGTLSIGCLAAALWWPSAALAVPLASDHPAAGPAPSHLLDAPTVPGISIWSFLHPGAADGEEPTSAIPPAASTLPATIEPSWVAGASMQDSVDSSFETTEIGNDRSGSAGTTLPQLSYGTHRSVRFSSQGSRVQRTDTGTDVAVSADRATSAPMSESRLAGKEYTNPESLLLSRLFRPPRTEIRLP
jgi:hypothetical protein